MVCPPLFAGSVMAKREAEVWQQEREFYHSLNDPTPMTSPEHQHQLFQETRGGGASGFSSAAAASVIPGMAPPGHRNRSVLPPSGASRPANHLEINKLAQVKYYIDDCPKLAPSCFKCS